LVLATSNTDALTQPMTDALRPLLREAHAQGLDLQVLDLGGTSESAALSGLLETAGGMVREVRSATDVRWALVEMLTGDSPLLATAAQLQVEFNPRAVAAYRLVGHEAISLGGLLSEDSTADLRVGEEATALFELWFYPNAGDELAVARLQWRDPRSSTTRHEATQRISRIQFATSWEGTPLSLQAAALAAEAGEILRQGYGFEVPAVGTYRYRPKPRTLQEVLAVADRVSPALAGRPEFRRFLSVLEQAQRLTPERRAGPAKAGTRGLVNGRWRDMRE